MDESQRILAKRRGLKSSITKLLGKIEDMMSVEIEHMSSESITESRWLTVTTILAQIRAKGDQISELDTAIAGKAQTAEELEEEICNADMYQTTLEERIAFLTEFIRKSSLTPVRSFITQKLADELQLQPTHQEIISVSSFGAQVSPSGSLAVATLFVHTLNDSLIPISALIIPKLAAPICNSVRTHLKVSHIYRSFHLLIQLQG